MDQDHQISKYDRRRGRSDLLFTPRPSTIKTVQNITGESETFTIETGRHAEEGDYIFVELTDKTGVTRICLPPAVARIIERQRNALTLKRRRIIAKLEAQRRKDAGIVPGFLRHKTKA